MDLTVNDGAIVGILGTNGAGKTTTLKAIAGTLPLSDGKIYFDGEDVSRLGAAERVKRGIVMVPSKGIFGSLSVQENLRLGGWVARRERDSAFLDRAMSQVFSLFPRLVDRLDQKASLLSGGEQQMLAIAQGLLARPKLLMIDELSLGLAPIVVSSILDVVRELNATGITVVIVEQSINASTTIANDAVFIDKGRVEFAGRTTQLTEQDQVVRAVFFGAKGTDGTVSDKEAARTESSSNRTLAIDAHGEDVVLSVRGLRKTFGAVTAVDSLDLDIYRGEILGIIGANGAGKTVTFDMLSGFTTPDDGRITYNGADITRASPTRRAALGFGRTFQDVRLLPSLTVSETLAVSLDRHTRVREPISSMLYLPSTARSERAVWHRVDELVGEFGLAPYRDTPTSDLSTGTRRILELACVAGHQPELLLLDEPSSGLSQRETEGMADVIREIRMLTGATVAIIEHDVPLVSSLADELVCMNLGSVICRGLSDDVLRNQVVIDAYLGIN